MTFLQHVCCVVALAMPSGPLHVAGSMQSDYVNSLAEELLGSHHKLFRGWVYAAPEDGPAVARPRERLLAGTPSAAKNITIPCLKFNVATPDSWTWFTFNYTVFDLVEPCGDLKLPWHGITFRTAFGTYHLSGDERELQEADNVFSEYTLWVLIGIAALYILSIVLKLPTQLKKIKNGQMSSDEDDPLASADEKKKSAKEKMDPNSDKFICPGNIYRLVVVMHPGVVGWKEWLQYCFKAGICAYMQFYLPFNILSHTLTQWQFNGTKSPFYFALNSVSFFSQFAALGNVCALFASKCSSVIESDAQALHYLLSHEEPKSDGKGSDPEKGSNPVTPEKAEKSEKAGRPETSGTPREGRKQVVPKRARDYQVTPEPEAPEHPGSTLPGSGDTKDAPLLDQAGAAAKLGAAVELMKAPPAWILNLNEIFWCILNLLLTCFMSVVMQLCIFMKVATFTGDIMNASLIAVSLYFVFDLDDKVMDSDPKLRPRYQREVLKQSEQADSKMAKIIKQTSSLTILVIGWLTPLGLLMIAAISWRQVSEIPYMTAPIVIGGDPFLR